jgi:hypothetical protein
MVWLAVMLMFFRPADALPVTDRSLKVLAPLMVIVPAEALVKDTL